MRYVYYEKPVTSELVLMKRSAISERTKVQVLAQDLVRRMRNSCVLISINERTEIVNSFLAKVKKSGYSIAQRKAIVAAGIKGYYQMRRTEILGGRKVNRGKDEGREERERNKMNGKKTWYNKNMLFNI